MVVPSRREGRLDNWASGAHSGRVTPQEYLSSIRADGDRIAAVGVTSLNSRVPTCPDWEVVDLLRHVGHTNRFFTLLAGLADGETDPPETLKEVRAARRSQQPPATEVVGWFRRGLDDLLRALEEAPPGGIVHTFYGSHGPDLLIRRAATEIAIHRWDADSVAGTPEPLSPALGAAGIEDFLEVLVPLFFKYPGFKGTGQTIHVQATDSDDEWSITVGEDTMSWHRGCEGTANVKVRGDLSDLYLFFWGRQTANPLNVIGDNELLTRWQTALAF